MPQAFWLRLPRKSDPDLERDRQVRVVENNKVKTAINGWNEGRPGCGLIGSVMSNLSEISASPAVPIHEFFGQAPEFAPGVLEDRLAELALFLSEELHIDRSQICTGTG